MVALLLAALLAVFFYDVVFLNRTLQTTLIYGSQRSLNGYTGTAQGNPYLLDTQASGTISDPAIRKESSIVRRLHAPLWDASTALGRPLLASSDTTVASPLRLPVIIWPWPPVWDAFLLGRLLIAGLFTYLLARRLGLGPTAGFGASVAFIFSGYFMLYLNHPHVDFAMMIPVLLYSLELLIERAGPPRVLFASGAVALSVLSNNSEAAVVILLFATAYYLYRSLEQTRRARDGLLWARLVRLGGVLVAGLALSGFALGPVLQLIGLPGRGGLSVSLHGPDSGRGEAHDPVRALISLFSPFFDGAPRRNFQGSGWSGIRNWTGVVTPVLALLAVRDRPGMRRFGWFCLGTAAFLVAKMYGFPVINRVGALPVLSQIDFPQYVAPVVSLVVALLAGLGLQSLAERRPGRWMGLVSAGVVAAAILILIWVNRSLLSSIPRSNLIVQLGLAAAFLIATVTAISALGRGVLRARAAPVLLVGLVVAELFVFTVPTKGQFAALIKPLYGSTHIVFVERPRRYDAFTEPRYIRFLQRDRSQYRVVALNTLLSPNWPMVFGIDDVRGFTATTVKRYLTYIANFVKPRVRHQLAHVFADELVQPPSDGPSLMGNPMFDLMNVKYVLTSAQAPLRLDTPLLSGGTLGDQLRLVYRGEVNIYQNLHALPRAFVVHQAVSVAGPDEAVAQMKQPGFLPQETAVIEAQPVADRLATLSEGSTADGSSATITHYSDSRVDITARMRSAGLVVLADTYYPGWRASVDGRKATIYATDETLRSVFVGAGTHRLTFTYAPTVFKAGSVITLLSLLALAVYTAWAWRARAPTAGAAPTEPEAPHEEPHDST